MRKKVLIIEDNLDLQDIYKIYLEQANFLVYVSKDGATGIVDLLKYSPDIVLLDIMMPGMNGYEVLETIKNQSSIHVPIIVCSNLNSEEDIKKAYELGADFFIKKSDYDGEQIIKKLIEFVA